MVAGHVFIITYGRSGSTLLQSILNSIPGYKINGENHNALFNLYRSYAALVLSKHKFAVIGDRPNSAWYGANDLDAEAFRTDIVQAFSRHVLRPAPDTRVLGFKEIRYHRCGDEWELEQFILFIEKSFPNTKIIFNTRSLHDVEKSAWWADRNPLLVRGMVKKLDRIFHEAYMADRSRRFLLKYEDYVKSPMGLKPLFDFLGEQFDYNRVKEILSVKLTH